jgi:hypothetical protein
LAVSSSLLNSAARGFAEQATQSKSELRSANELIAQAQRIATHSTPQGLSAVATFNTEVQQAAAQRGVVVSEFTSAADQLPYLSRFTKKTEENEWMQIELSLRLQGALRDVVGTITAFRDFGVAYELNAIEFTRLGVSGDGSAKVEAKVTMRVLSGAKAAGA